MFKRIFYSGLTLLLAGTLFVFTGCGGSTVTVNSNQANANSYDNSRTSNTIAANNANTNSSSVTQVPEAAEPDTYQATVTMKIEAIGQQRGTFPTLTAQVARSGADRRMVFTMPAGGRVVYLDKAGTNYLVLPDRHQYAELNRESLGFEVRRLMMPEQIVGTVRNVHGVERVGEEKYNGRDAIRYRYASVADTQSRAGQVATNSFLIVDKATGLPLHAEIASQSQSGANVQGYSGVRIVTTISDIQTEAPAEMFAEPTDLQKIESSTVRAQVYVIFNSLAAMLSQALDKARSSTASPAPVR